MTMNIDIKHTVFTTDGNMVVGMGHQQSYDSAGARLFLVKIYDSEGNLLADYSNVEDKVVVYDIPAKEIKAVELSSKETTEAFQDILSRIEVEY